MFSVSSCPLAKVFTDGGFTISIYKRFRLNVRNLVYSQSAFSMICEV